MSCRPLIGLSYVTVDRQNPCNSLSQNAFNFLPCAQIREDGAVFYWSSVHQNTNKHGRYSIMTARSLAYSGTMKDRTRKNIRKAIDLLLQASPSRIIYNPVSKFEHPFRVNFMTLTVSDSRIRLHRNVYRDCLSPFLRWLRARGASLYVWKAELQARGQVHYHITTNVFIHYREIRDRWNLLQARAGYLDEYRKEHGHINANSTDVHSVARVKNLGRYLMKYVEKEVSKTAPGARISGKVWDCSKQLKGKFYSVLMDNETSANVNRAIRAGRVVHIGDWYSYSPGAAAPLLSPALLADYHNFIRALNPSLP